MRNLKIEKSKFGQHDETYKKLGNQNKSMRLGVFVVGLIDFKGQIINQTIYIKSYLVDLVGVKFLKEPL